MAIILRNSLALLLAAPMSSFSAVPDCTGAERWPTKMAFTYLKDAVMPGFHSGFSLEGAKTVRLSSEKIGKDLYRQVHLVTFTDDQGKPLQVITVNNASSDECSMTGVDVYVVSRHFGGP